MKSRSIYISIICAVCICIFAVMLFFNFSTTLLVDDYAYIYNFSVGDDIISGSDLHPSVDSVPIQSLKDVFSSMAAHRHSMNGRVIPHGLGQLFLWLSPSLFKVINAAVYVFQILLICSAAALLLKGGKNEYIFRFLLLCAVFSALYMFTPSFGQINLWLIGSVNYLWGSTVSILFISLVLRFFVFDNAADKNSVLRTVVCVILGFAAGSWTENGGGALLVFMVCVLIAKLLCREKISLRLVITALAVAAGFIFLLSAPAEMKNKIGEGFGISRIFHGIFDVIWLFESLFKPLCIATAVLFVLCLFACEDKKPLIYVFILILSALAAAFCLALGLYIADRSFFYTVPVLVMADAMMCAMLLDKKRELIFSVFVVLIMFMPHRFYLGAMDIHHTYTEARANEIYITECVNNGIYDISIPFVTSETGYSALHAQKYIDVHNPGSWPNCYMAKYYGADSISCSDAKGID